MHEQIVTDAIQSFCTSLDLGQDDISELKDGVLTVRVVGEFSAGKTRLIRELLSDKIPKRLQPISSQEAQTRLQLEISYGVDAELLLIKRPEDVDHAEIILNLDSFPTREDIFEYDPNTYRLRLLLDEKRLILTEGDGYSEGHEPKKLFLIDTPGWNSGEDDLAEQDASKYFIGEHNLGIIYICHANRLDSEINKKRLKSFLTAFVDGFFIHEKKYLNVVITHCEEVDQQRLSQKVHAQVLQLWENLGCDADELQLDINAIDFATASVIEQEKIKQNIWHGLLSPLNQKSYVVPTPKSYATQILASEHQFEIRPLILKQARQLQRLRRCVARLCLEDQFLHNMSMTRLKGLTHQEIVEKLKHRWCRQMAMPSVDDIQQLTQFQNLEKQHGLYEWYTNYWLKQVQQVVAPFKLFLNAIQITFEKITPQTIDLQQIFTQQLQDIYQQLLKDIEKQQSFFSLLEVIEYEMTELGLDQFIATLLNISQLQSRYEALFYAKNSH